VAFVHMGSDAQAAAFFGGYGLGDVPRVSDPSASLYRAFGLARGNLGQIAGPAVWLRGLSAMTKGHLAGAMIGDTFQMPGVFLVSDGQILKAFRHETTADVPDYEALATCPLPPSR
jgi:hypothetical protein